MTDIQEPKITRVPVDQITMGDRLRPVVQVGVDALVQSIQDLGVMKDPIHVRKKGRGDDAQLILIAGGHRLAAAKVLGWETIPARVWADVTNDYCTMMEIDDNLAGADLGPLDLAVFLSRRKPVYERMYPETKNGANGGRGGKKNETEIISFSKSVAEQRDMSPRHIRNFVRIGEQLTDWEVAALRDLDAPLGVSALMALSKLDNPNDRQAVVRLLGAGEVTSVADGIAALDDGDAPAPDAPLLSALSRAWTRANAQDRAAFALEHGDELTALIEGTI
ncbi:MAG: ParB/RepB/Spo0J family partition protein [Planktomarina sp.]